MRVSRRQVLKSLSTVVGGLVVSAHHKPWHDKGPPTTTTTTAPTTTTTTTTTPTSTDPDNTYGDVY